MEHVPGVAEIVQTVEKVKELEQHMLLKTQNEYLEEIASLTEVSVSTLKSIKHEWIVNAGVWNIAEKKRPHKLTLLNLGRFDIDAIRNKVNEFYIVKKEVPTL